ncbi:AAA family ATPase [Tessaracoccus caeni]|uniref:AAA family ATPase n=1 Tax=Tessaracoccus caeni TaxID=3031239 RepID=UPI0023DB2CA2|nr:ATP-binding protein [Tessaracoccus caeni]MDF1488040.1 ATP-binding protein [Tessaracoccus caeni]
MELSLVAIDQRPEVREFPRVGVGLLPVAGVFGPNASGKTNMLAALAWLRTAVMTSMRNWDESIPVEPFAFESASGRDSSFVLEMEVHGVRFEYLLDVGVHKVSYEALFHYPKGRRRLIFEREDKQLSLQRGLGELSGTRALLTNRSLVLSIASRFDERYTSSFANTLRRVTSLGQPLGGRRRGMPGSWRSTLRVFEDDQDALPFLDEQSAEDRGSRRDRAISLLRMADLGVADVEIEEPDEGESALFQRGIQRPQLVHIVGGQRKALPYESESSGTQAWFELIGPVLTALDYGSVVLFDEFDASLHPTLTAQLVKLFEEPGSNPRGAQLIFTAHDTNLLNHLNRDEVWLTDKLNGATRFAPLSDFAGERVRQSRNLETGYLSGRFGALPDVAQPEVLRSLGLIG